MLCISIPCFPTCLMEILETGSFLYPGKAALKTKKQKRNWHLHGFRDFPGETPIFWATPLACCQAARRTIHLGPQAAALMEIQVAQAELVRLGVNIWDKHRPLAKGDDFSTHLQVSTNMVNSGK